MSVSTSGPVRATQLDVIVASLETNLRKDPSNKSLIQALIRVLSVYVPNPAIPGLGAYTRCQKRLLLWFKDDVDSEELVDTDVALKHYNLWLKILRTNGLTDFAPETQWFVDPELTINGEVAECGTLLQLFNQTGVIGNICHSCYKVQILPVDLVALVQVNFILQDLKLPRHNARKCMVEIRKDIPNPYKGYIYCQSEDEARLCLDIFRERLQHFGITNVLSAISHGCSEFGARYPDWKYSPQGEHRTFERAENWDAIEVEFNDKLEVAKEAHAQKQASPMGEDLPKLKGLTLRDVMAMNTWIDYAEIIGDETWKVFHDKPAENLAPLFENVVREQAEMRASERMALKEKLAVSNG